MNQTTFEIRTLFPIEAGTAFEIVTDPLCLPAIHPLITRVEPLRDNHFVCYETAPVLFFPYRFQYRVNVNKNRTGNFAVMESEVRKGLRIKLSFSMLTIEDASFIIEKIEITGPYIARTILAAKLKKAHYKMFENLKRLVAQSARPYFSYANSQKVLF